MVVSGEPAHTSCVHRTAPVAGAWATARARGPLVGLCGACVGGWMVVAVLVAVSVGKSVQGILARLLCVMSFDRPAAVGLGGSVLP